ncbi:RNA polymerase factor sigma-54 [Bacillus sp. NSP9.1]|nr:hypothetical protein M654_012920 [Bacillus sp. NSP9.1]
MNESGYLTISVEETSEILALPYETVQQSLQFLQSFDPLGAILANLCFCK